MRGGDGEQKEEITTISGALCKTRFGESKHIGAVLGAIDESDLRSSMIIQHILDKKTEPGIEYKT